MVYAHLAPVFFEIDNVFGRENFVDDNNDKITPYSHQVEVMETECNSPCPSSRNVHCNVRLTLFLFPFYLKFKATTN